MKIIVASKNPVKINAALAGFQKMFPEEKFTAEGIDVSSGVGHQPMGDEETLEGARQRVAAAALLRPDADFWVGIEGGVQEHDGEMQTIGWAVVMARDGKEGKGKTSTFYLPQSAARLVRQGKELGDANDIVFHQTNSKQADGSIGLLTGNLITRTDYYIDAIIFALIPFKNRELY